jgi:hypothetical protein
MAVALLFDPGYLSRPDNNRTEVRSHSVLIEAIGC